MSHGLFIIVRVVGSLLDSVAKSYDTQQGSIGTHLPAKNQQSMAGHRRSVRPLIVYRRNAALVIKLWSIFRANGGIGQYSLHKMTERWVSAGAIHAVDYV